MKKVKTNKLGRRILSFVLNVALMVGLMRGNIQTVSADGTDTVISDELIVESVSSNNASATTECICETDDPAFHATNCPAYIAPENPQCFCAEKCTEDTLNIWCDICGVQGVNACQGEDTAVAYTDVVASITNGETVTNYATFADALANWTDGTTLTLLADVTGLTERIKTYAKGLILDLNGHKIECSDNWTIWIDGDSGSELTIRDSNDGGYIQGVVYAVAGGSKLCLESGTVETVSANGDFTMTGGQIISEDGSGLNVNNDVDVVISGGEIYGSRYGVWISIGNVTISGDTKITGAGQYAIWSSSSAVVVISGTPTISGGAGEFVLNSKITLNTQPADGETWRVKIDTEEITDGLFAVPGEGVTLDASRFASTMDGYDVKQNAKGELLLCNHQTAYAAVSNEDGSTHKMLCCCRETTVEESVACSGFGATCQTKAVCAACGQSYGETNPDVHTFNDDGKCVCGAERDAATTVDLSSLTATYVISDSGEYIFTGSGSYGIKVESGNPKIVLNNVNISLTDGDYYENNPINGIHIATTGGTTEILVLGESSITAKAGAGIFVAEGGTVKITGSSREDILIATGASGCSGIGGYVYYTNGSVNCGNIEISNVTVKAFGSDSSMGDRTPAIGGAGNGNCGYITIDNADVYAEGYINPCGYEGSSAIGTGDGWGNREGGTIGEISIINDSKVYVTRGNYCDYIGCCGRENAPAEGVVDATAKSSTIYCYDTTDTTKPVQTLKYGALGGLLKEDGTCEGEHTGIICDNCGYCSCTHEGVEPTYALTEDSSRHTTTWSCCGYEVTEEHSWNCESDEANTNKMTFSCGCTKGGTITVTGPEGAIYDGNNHTATVTVETKENEELIETPVITYDSLTEGVELVDGKPVNAGTYQANVSFEGVLSYQEFEIKKATPYVATKPTASALTYGQTLNQSVLSNGVIHYSETDSTVVAGSFAWEAGTVKPAVSDSATTLYNVLFTPDDSDNYKEVTVKLTVSVNKAEATALNNANKTYVYAESKKGESVSIEGLPEDCGSVSYEISSISDTNNMLENVSVDATGKLIYDVKSLNAYSNGLSATVTVTVSMQNYEDLTYTLTVVRTDKLVQNISVENITLTYGDADVTISVTGAKTELSYEVVEDSNDNGYVVSVDANGKVSIENAGTAIIKITAVASDTYAESECEIRVTVNKRPVNVPAKDSTVYTYTGKEQTYSIASSPYYTIENATHIDAGKYEVVVNLNENYVWNGNLPTYEFEIKPATVNIQAESYTVKKGDTLPTFYYDVTGLVNNETLPITVSIACTASDTNTVGTYDITVSGISSEGNYTYVYTNGVLEVLAEDEAPFITGDDGKMGWDAIGDEIEDANKGDTIVVDMNGATVVPGDIIEEARDKGITISFVLDNGLTWTIDGSTVTDGDIRNINFDTTVEDENNPLNNIPVDVINGVTGEKETIEVNLTYSGNFGFTAVLKANLGSDNAGYYANLYYYNPTTGKLEYMCADVIASNGEAELTFTHASDYLIIIDDENLGNAPDDDDNTTEDKDDGKDKVLDTGDDGTLYLWVLMLCALIGMVGVTYYEKLLGKRNES